MELGVSQVKFARILGIPRSYLSRVENEHLLPGPAMLARFANYLGIDFCSIWEGHEAGSTRADQSTGEIIARAETLPVENLLSVLRRARALVNSAPATTAGKYLKVA